MVKIPIYILTLFLSGLLGMHVLAASKLPLSHKVVLNKATLSQLMQLPGVGEKRARAILLYRQQNGRFSSLEELASIRGLGPRFVKKHHDQLQLD